MLNIHPLSALSTNYIWVLEKDHKPDVYIVDPGEAEPVLNYLHKTDKRIAGILVTHQHWDHVTGIPELVAVYQCPVFGPAIEKHLTVTHALSEGDTLQLWGEVQVEVMETPGHLPDHICYKILEGEQLRLLCADTLFSAGCGRIFRGSPQQLKHSLERIAALPPSTLLYPAHEYTQANLKFALAVEPDKPELEHEYQRISALRRDNLPSLPTSVAHELKINPFLRCHDPAIVASVSQHTGHTLENELAVFTELRQWKNVY